MIAAVLRSIKDGSKECSRKLSYVVVFNSF